MCCCRSRRSPKPRARFVNAEGRLQSFHAVVKPLGETRPAWKVLRVLGNLLGLPGFDAESSQAVLEKALPGVASGATVAASRLDNTTAAAIDTRVTTGTPCVAAIYQLDGWCAAHRRCN
jgi:NADH-quinone oxidoreductase subunit G